MLERNIMKFTKMKTRNFMFLVIIILMTSAIIWLINVPSPHLRSFVSKTQLHIKNINSKLKVLDQDDDDDDDSNDRGDLEVDSTYLELLGFVKNPKLFQESDETSLNLNAKASNTNMNSKNNNDDEINSNFNNQLLVNIKNLRIPPLVTAFMRFSDKEKALIESKLKYFLNDLIIIYDLDLSSSEQLKIKKLCNSSCLLKTFKGDKYPNHLVDPKMKAYKPIIIQDVLNEYESLIWIEPPNIFSSNNIDNFLAKSKQNGLVAWPLRQPVTQMTHPSMFKYFQAKPNDFYFVHILDTTRFILFNNKKIHLSLMLPWVKCALKKDCIAPAGSKYNGCDFTRRPAFLYSGCHRYEMSSFSIITALLFKFDQTKYTTWADTINTNKTVSFQIDNENDSSSFIQNYYENTLMATDLLDYNNNKRQTIS